jgi:uncharacterized protein (TIGR02266 family)
MEKRIAPRIKVSTAVAFSSAGDFLLADVMNISGSGVFIKTATVLPVATELALRIRLPEDLETMDIDGRVVWAKQASSASPAGMGVEFIKMSHDHKSKINAFVEKRAGELSRQRCCKSQTETSV